MKWILFFCLLFFLFSSCTQSNLINNPGAETKPVTNEWTIEEGRWTQRYKQPLPQEGKAYFFPGVALHAELYQDVDVSNYALATDLGLINADYSSYVRVFPQVPADISYEVVEFRDENGTVLDSFRSANIDSTASWIHLTDNRKLQKGTRTIRVRLLADRKNGSNNDGYHDDVSLTLSFSILVYLFFLLVVILVAWLLLSKRKKKVKKA